MNPASPPPPALDHPRTASSTSSRRRLDLTAAQRDIWMGQSLHPTSSAFRITLNYPIETAIDKDRFLAAAHWVFSTYEALHARLVTGSDGVPQQEFDPAYAPPCNYVDFSDQADPAAALAAHLRRLSTEPMPVLNAPLARPHLAKLGENRYSFFCAFHHVMIDGWGVGIVFPRIARAYDALSRGTAPAREPGDFIAFIQESLEPLSPDYLEKAAAYWRPMWAEPVPPVPSALGDSGPQVPTAAQAKVLLPRELVDRVSARASAANATFYHALLLAFGWMLRTHFGLEPCSLALPILNRSRDHKETIGACLATSKSILPLDGAQTVDANLAAISRRMRELYRYFRYPATEINRLCQSQGNGDTPTTHGTLSYVPRDFGSTINGVFVPMQNVPSGHQQSPMALFVLDVHPGRAVSAELVYQQTVFSPEEADWFVRRLPFLLEQFCVGGDRPLDAFELMPDAERRLMASFLDHREGFRTPDTIVLDMILAAARRTPDVVAVESELGSATYRRCIAQAGAIAHELVRSRGVGRGDRVAVLLPRSPDLVATLLGVMMSGAVAVPLDLKEPAARAQGIVNACAARCLVTSTREQERAREIHPTLLLADALPVDGEPFASRATADDVAIIIHTSGTTGKPKGVEITHRNLTEHIPGWFKNVDTPGANRWLWFSSPAFDASLECFLPALIGGHTLVCAPHPQWPAHQFADVIVRQRLHWIFLPPAYLIEVLKAIGDDVHRVDGHGVAVCVSGGDSMVPFCALRWRAVFGPASRLINIYGPTEITVSATCYEVPGDYDSQRTPVVPVGVVHHGRKVRIVNAAGRDVPFKAEGELLIGGAGVTRGYHGLPEQTAQRFVTLEDGVRYYRSGDAVHLDTDGNLVFHRRLDQQVKIRGYRVELAEIEAVLLTHPAIRECAVIAAIDPDDGDKHLHAFVVRAPQQAIDTATLREYVTARLPAYMVPAINWTDALPKNKSGKIERKALVPESHRPRPAAPPPPKPPAVISGATREYVALLWEETLGQKPSSPAEDFFAAGGHSLLAARMTAKLGKAFRVDYPLAHFFEHPTIDGIAKSLDQLVGSSARVEAMAKVRLELARMTPEQIAARLQQLKQAGKAPVS